MPWVRHLLEPQQGPQLADEELERRVRLHQAQLDAEQDRIAEVIRARLNGPAKASTHAR
jgi:hypothetical protein